ncbi:MAG: hypothetical protein AAF573_17340 [Bacteroidota bacterium]
MFWKRKIRPEDRKQWLYEAIAAYCEPKGFELVSSKNQFRKKTPLGFQTIILSLGVLPKSTLFEVHLGIRNDAIEKLAFQFTNSLALFQRDSMTLVSSIARLQNIPYQRFEIVKATDVDPAIENVITYMEQEGLGWLEKYQSLQTIHEALNSLPLSKTKLMSNQIYRCFRGLVAAKLTNQPNYAEIEKAYDAFLIDLYIPEYQLATFEKLKNYLRNFSAN